MRALVTVRLASSRYTFFSAHFRNAGGLPDKAGKSVGGAGGVGSVPSGPGVILLASFNSHVQPIIRRW